MPDFQVVVTARPGRQVPARVAGLLLPLDIEITALHVTQPSCGGWRVELTARVPSRGHLEFLVKRLHRLIDVIEVCTASFGDESSDADPVSVPRDVTDPGSLAYAN
jgi:acetolactate synthase I/III small subunit